MLKGGGSKESLPFLIYRNLEIMAPPKKELNEAIIYDLAKIHCTMNEIASVCDCSVDTLERRYADIIKKGRDEGKSSLKRLQWKAAEAGNITMMIWLGKQTLGQSDRVRSDITSGGDKIQPIIQVSPMGAEELRKLAADGK